MQLAGLVKIIFGIITSMLESISAQNVLSFDLDLFEIFFWFSLSHLIPLNTLRMLGINQDEPRKNRLCMI